jgi:hypothetical protein
MKRTISLLLAIITVFLLAGCSGINGDTESLKFKETGGGYALYRYKGNSKKTSFAVPDEHNGKPVVEIMDFALANSEYLIKISIGSNIERIGDWAFTNCGALKEYTADENSKYFKAVDGMLYNKDMTELISYPNGKAPLQYDSDKRLTGGGEIVIPQSVNKIRSNAFYICGNLYKVTFNNGLVEIGDKAFIKCSNLQNFTLPDTLQKIGVDAFSFCDSLTAVTIPASVTVIGDYAFFSMSSSVREVVIRRKDGEGLQTGRDWLPKLKDTVNTKAEIKYIP